MVNCLFLSNFKQKCHSPSSSDACIQNLYSIYLPFFLSELLEEVLPIPGNKFVVESIKKQLEHLKKQPRIIHRKKEDFARRKRQKSVERKQKLERERVKASAATEDEEFAKDDFDGGNLVEASDQGSDETDSLLTCLNDNMVEESDGFTYKTSELRKFFSSQRSKSRDSEEKASVEEQTSDSPKTILIQKLERQNKELMEHVCHLFKSWNSCEEENTQLKERMKLLEQELETLRSTNMEKSVLNQSNVELSLPFQSEYFGDDRISSLPSLPPLDLPNELQMSGLYSEEEYKHKFQEEM